MKICRECYHCIEISEEDEHFLICALHNSECENEEACGFFVEGGEDD